MSSPLNKQTLRLSAPAKINLFLHITGRRADGYHALESVFVPISLADTVELTLRHDREIRLLDAPVGLTSENDLACRAARALQAETGCALGVDIHLSKRIPQGAGLGGGSSDAAAALLGLKRLWGLQITSERLLSMGLNLGADVPFFIAGQPAFVSGVGEKLRPLTVPTQHLVLAHPDKPVSTAQVFQHDALKRDSPSSASPVFTMRHGGNDMQRAAMQIEPAISALRESMSAIGLTPRMSGSGSAVFALVSDAMTARKKAQELAAGHVAAWAVQTLYRHPLQSQFGTAII
jgi:4-diphosphocytidyl-2-C-methyl-D-erythritol kinase